MIYILQISETAAIHNTILADDVTIVTSYFNIGGFLKGEYGNYYTVKHYERWMQIFGQIHNPVVSFFEEDKYIKMFTAIRSHLPANMTKINKVSERNLWAFSIKPKLHKIFSSPGYPRYHPNTVVLDYSCIMHAKYEFMASVASQNPFKTKYVAWLDIGLFRGILNKKDIKPFKLYIPPQFNESSVAYSQVGRLYNETAEVIFKRNLVFVCGCFFIGTMSVMHEWANQYKYYLEKYLNMGIANTDQQVLYAMLVDGIEQPSITIQPYFGQGKYNPWFHLGYVCKEEWQKKRGHSELNKMFLKYSFFLLIKRYHL